MFVDRMLVTLQIWNFPLARSIDGHQKFYHPKNQMHAIVLQTQEIDILNWMAPWSKDLNSAIEFDAKPHQNKTFEIYRPHVSQAQQMKPSTMRLSLDYSCATQS